jgi:hypothetical protein
LIVLAQPWRSVGHIISSSSTELARVFVARRKLDANANARPISHARLLPTTVSPVVSRVSHASRTRAVDPPRPTDHRAFLIVHVFVRLRAFLFVVLDEVARRDKNTRKKTNAPGPWSP